MTFHKVLNTVWQKLTNVILTQSFKPWIKSHLFQEITYIHQVKVYLSSDDTDNINNSLYLLRFKYASHMTAIISFNTQT